MKTTTYSELYERMYGVGDTGALDRLPREDRLAWLIIRLFDSRGGFDHWWGRIDEETQDEIFEDLRKLLKETE